jgi:hypothetical protein
MSTSLASTRERAARTSSFGSPRMVKFRRRRAVARVNLKEQKQLGYQYLRPIRVNYPTMLPISTRHGRRQPETHRRAPVLFVGRLYREGMSAKRALVRCSHCAVTHCAWRG